MVALPDPVIRAGKALPEARPWLVTANGMCYTLEEDAQGKYLLICPDVFKSYKGVYDCGLAVKMERKARSFLPRSAERLIVRASLAAWQQFRTPYIPPELYAKRYYPYSVELLDRKRA